MEARKNVVGGQCCNWTSHTVNRYQPLFEPVKRRCAQMRTERIDK